MAPIIAGGNMITLAFYVGWGGGWRDMARDALIRIATLSKAAHVELIEGRADLGDTALCWSSSPRDGGVRGKYITLDPDKWVLVHLDADGAKAGNTMRLHGGKPYDTLGALLSPLRLRWPVQWYHRWFCSEIVAEALGWPDPWRWSPARMWRKLR